MLSLTGLVVFVVGAVYMLLQGILSLVISLVISAQIAFWWPYGYQIAMAAMVMGIGIMVANAFYVRGK